MAIAAAECDLHEWNNVVEYLRRNTHRINKESPTDWERQTLAIVACNENPRSFGGIDYVAKIKSFYDGFQIGDHLNLYDDFFGILALVASGMDPDSPIIQTTIEHIKERQRENGGWGDVDSTAAAVMALIAAGEKPDSSCITNALSFIKTMQKENGGFQSWGTTNAASTAWAINAIVATGGDPTEWKNNGNSPVDFLISLQQPNGCFNWTTDQNLNPEWMTAYAVPALLGKTYPVKTYESKKESNDNWVEYEWTGDIRIEGKDDTIWHGEVTVGSSIINALNDSSGEIEEYYIPYPSVLGALDEASKKAGFSYYVVYYSSWDAFYVKTIADDSDWWHYWVDYNLPMIGAGSYELTEKDEEILFGYLEDWYAHALRITSDKNEVKKSEKFTVNVYNETMSSVENAVVYVDSQQYLTDANGEVEIKIDTPGCYKIYSEKGGYVRSEKILVCVKKTKAVKIIKPEDNAIYLFNKKTRIPSFQTLVIGPIDIEVETTDDVEKVEFYLDDNLKYIDRTHPFRWRLNEWAFLKRTKINVKAYPIDNEELFHKIQRILRCIAALPEEHPYRTSLDLIESILENIETSQIECNGNDEKEIVIINLFPRFHKEVDVN